jgi:osmotically-inducible protein OsmY
MCGKLELEGAMTKKQALKMVGSLMFAIFVLVSTAMFSVGCNTVQSPNRQVADSQITAQVKTKLAQEVRASSLANIDVNTTNGVVTLAGQVENTDVKRSAETVATTVPGVVRVNNDLQVEAAAASMGH